MECEQHLSRPGPLVIAVRIAHAEPGPVWSADPGPRIDPRVPVVARLLGFDVVLADDAGRPRSADACPSCLC